jgi:hypothetical protein
MTPSQFGEEQLTVKERLTLKALLVVYVIPV